MRKTKHYNINSNFKTQLLHWAQQFNNICFLDSNNYPPQHTEFSYNSIVGIGKIEELKIEAENNFEQIENFYAKKKDWLFGYLSYDLKNEIEPLSSTNFDGLQFPTLHFFQQH